jgi:hypothetical protein
VDEINGLGDDLVARLRETVGKQVHKAIARHIHTKVRDARSDPDLAARRWPFELIQNAHDAGPRKGQDSISVTFCLSDGVLRFEHNAAPFTMNEFAALLTGGSSKDFLSTETTGRFGTGFLVTHVLSQRVKVNGIIKVDDQHRGFRVDLDRPDDEVLILRNIKESEASLGHTRDITDLAQEPTATFEYAVDNAAAALDGLDAIEQALPYLMATCRRLREIKIKRGDQEVTWKVDNPPKDYPTDEIDVSEYAVSVVKSDGAGADWRLIRAAIGPLALGQIVLALGRDGDTWTVCNPGNVPRIFRQLPLIGGPALPGWAIIDGQFDVEQERRGIYVAGDAARPLREAFAALGGLMLLAIRERWSNGFRVAQLAIPAEVTGAIATKVWREILSAAANTLSQLPLVSTSRGQALPGVGDTRVGRIADFIQPTTVGPSHDELWELAAACTKTDPPAKSVSEGWSEIAKGWEELGVKVSWLDLKLVGEYASYEVTDISGLRVERDPYDWLYCYLNAVGKAWEATGVTKSHLAHLLPDQHGNLHGANDLRRDGGVSDRVKEISDGVDVDLRGRLLDRRFIGDLTKLRFEPGLYAIREATGDELSENDAVDDLVRNLSDALPDEQKLGSDATVAGTASVELLAHLWNSQGKGAEHIAWRIPVLAADGTARRAGSRRLMVPPVSTWPETARPFSEAYPASRVLSDAYACREGCPLEALAVWGIVHDSLLTIGQREEISDRGLKSIASNPVDASGATLRGAELTQIALLEPELINYCRQSRQRAQALLGLVVCFVASQDKSWRTLTGMSVRTPDGEKQIQLTPSLWLSDLKSKPWIPVEDENDVTHHIANPELVRDLLDPLWLGENASGADLLVRHFGIDALDVRLLAAASNEEARQRLRNSLARIVEVVGGNAYVIDELLAKIQQKSRDVDRMRKLGLAVQECVKNALEKRKLSVEFIDYGYDFLVTSVRVPDDDAPEEMSAHFEVGGYKLEVKATTAAEVRLSPLQASTCANDPDLFVLCVVDLRNFQGDVHQVDWATIDVSSRCKLVVGREIHTGETLLLVDSAEETDIPIRNTKALRYAVRSDLWEAGLDFVAWVDLAFPIRVQPAQ